jgi:hypothetical protein
MVRCSKQWRPSITWMQPRLTRSLAVRSWTCSPAKLDRPFGDLAPLGLEQVGDRLQRRRLAGAVGAEQGDDLAFRHRQRDPFEHQDHMVVDHLDVVHRKDCSAGCVLRGGLIEPDKGLLQNFRT